ncbi:hypothetical protein NLX62_05775 [Mycobacteriaceae bacterium Msp059]|nr:hypothetical protein [Mycobacteriaceae bacterium Msp059]
MGIRPHRGLNASARRREPVLDQVHDLVGDFALGLLGVDDVGVIMIAPKMVIAAL